MARGKRTSEKKIKEVVEVAKRDGSSARLLAKRVRLPLRTTQRVMTQHKAVIDEAQSRALLRGRRQISAHLEEQLIRSLRQLEDLPVESLSRGDLRGDLMAYSQAIKNLSAGDRLKAAKIGKLPVSLSDLLEAGRRASISIEEMKEDMPILAEMLEKEE